MENEQNKDPKNDPKQQARNLFFQTALTQAQIAELIGVSQKTISLWMNEGKWKMLRETTDKIPIVLVEHMLNELSELQNTIASREPGKRFATNQEAETRRKIIRSIGDLRRHETRSAHAEVMMNFMSYVQKRNLADAKLLIKHADAYMQGEVQIGVPLPFVPYTLPGHIESPNPADLPTNNNTIPPPPDEKNKPDSLNEAA